MEMATATSLYVSVNRSVLGQLQCCLVCTPDVQKPDETRTLNMLLKAWDRVTV